MAQDRDADAARARRAVSLDPRDRVSWHSLAAAEGDLGNAREAERAARRALELGIPAPETRLVLARALQDLNQLDEAEHMFEEALALRPLYAEAHRDLAQLRWMRTGQEDAALRTLDAALARAPHDLHLLRQAPHLCAQTRQSERAVNFARRAVGLAPDLPLVQII